MEATINFLLKNRDTSGKLFIGDEVLDIADMIEAYKIFILDWILDTKNPVKQIKLIKIWNT